MSRGIAVALGALVALAIAPSAQAQVPDADFWKGTPERQDTVSRLVYSQSPQSVPSAYDPVAEAEEILREKQRTLPSGNPQTSNVWRQARDVSIRSGLTPALRTLGAIGLGVSTFEIGWKIGTGINAKLLKVGVPPATDGPQNYRWHSIGWRTANSGSHYGAYYPSQDGWVIAMRQTCCTFAQLDRWFNAPCTFSGFTPPPPFTIQGPAASTAMCYRPTGNIPVDVYWGWAPENALGVTGSPEPYTNQPYAKSSPAPTPPAQSTVEQAIETELEVPENEELRQWLNYELGSPSEEDPVGVGAPNPDIEFPDVEEHWERHGPKFSPAYVDPHEYWQDAADIVERGDNQDPDIDVCVRGSDQAVLYWDAIKEAVVIVKDGKIVTYFPPDNGIDYWVFHCDN